MACLKSRQSLSPNHKSLFKRNYSQLLWGRNAKTTFESVWTFEQKEITEFSFFWVGELKVRSPTLIG